MVAPGGAACGRSAYAERSADSPSPRHSGILRLQAEGCDGRFPACPWLRSGEWRYACLPVQSRQWPTCRSSRKPAKADSRCEWLCLVPNIMPVPPALLAILFADCFKRVGCLYAGADFLALLFMRRIIAQRDQFARLFPPPASLAKPRFRDRLQAPAISCAHRSDT